MIVSPKGEIKLLTLFLFQRELSQLKNDYQSSADTAIKQQILKDIALLTEAIKEMKKKLEAKRSLHYADDI
ncbi:hypothetical protein METH109765_18845 [Mesobacillus thioparans]